jgi:hypothetical protein
VARTNAGALTKAQLAELIGGPLEAAQGRNLAEFLRDCARWITQKGYSRDYIELKVGTRQRGSLPAATQRGRSQS